MDVVDALAVPLSIEGRQMVLVDAIQMDKTFKYIRGMYEYNSLFIKHAIDIMDFDCFIVNDATMPQADFHFTFGVREQKLTMTIIKLENKGGTPIYSGPYRDFRIEKVINSFQHYFDDSDQRP